MVYFQRNSIKSIALQGNNLVIEYNNSQTETRTATAPELQQIRSYCQEQRLNTLTLSDLQKQGTSASNPTNYWPWIIGGIGITTVIGVILFVSLRKKKE